VGPVADQVTVSAELQILSMGMIGANHESCLGIRLSNLNHVGQSRILVGAYADKVAKYPRRLLG
jgi:hypothetical protein